MSLSALVSGIQKEIGLFLILGIVVWEAVSPVSAYAAKSAVIFVYHRFGEAAYPATDVRIDQFEAQIAELKSGDYAVLSVPEILHAIAEGQELPDRVVGLTIDDAFRTAYTKAWPRLKSAGVPFTLFVTTDAIDHGYSGYMTWDEIRELAANGVTIGAHSASHMHMAEASEAAIAADIARSNRRFKEELGSVPELFAYPYGEVSLAARRQVDAAGYRFAFGQFSSVVHAGSDFLDLPRYTVNERYGALPEFRRRARALPLLVTNVTPEDALIAGENPPPVAFTLEPGLSGIEALSCFTGQGPVSVEQVGDARLKLRLDRPLPPGASYLNCTLPGPEDRWRWFGKPFYVPKR